MYDIILQGSITFKCFKLFEKGNIDVIYMEFVLIAENIFS